MKTAIIFIVTIAVTLYLTACAAPGSIKTDNISPYTEMTCVAAYGNELGDCDSNYR